MHKASSSGVPGTSLDDLQIPMWIVIQCKEIQRDGGRRHFCSFKVFRLAAPEKWLEKVGCNSVHCGVHCVPPGPPRACAGN